MAFAEGLPEHFEVFVPHHPGFGMSCENPAIDSIDGYVEHYRDLFDTLGIARAHVVASSMGGRLAAEFAARYPERVERLVLAAPAGLTVPAHPLPDLSTVPPEEFPALLVQDIRVLLPFLPEGPDEEFGAMRAREGAAVMRLLRGGSLDNPEMPSLLATIKSPTLLLWGSEDRLIPVGQAEYWQQAIPDAQLKVFTNVGHLPLDESSEARQALLEFLRQ
ncbi:4,5:9,10-diseco-3-hydroxy-5,9,17-trioxoandrosta-1(10),2-diene-4-oate hydrolase [compost metagenome]